MSGLYRMSSVSAGIHGIRREKAVELEVKFYGEGLPWGGGG